MHKELYVASKNIPITIQQTEGSSMHSITFTVCDWEVPSGAQTALYILKGDDNEVYAQGTISGQDLTFQTSTQMNAYVGHNDAQIQITANSKVLNSFLINWEVEGTIIDASAEESTSEYTNLQTLINSATSAIEDCEDAAEEAIAAAEAARDPVTVGAVNLVLNTSVNGHLPILPGATEHKDTAVTAFSSDDGLLTLTMAANANAAHVYLTHAESQGMMGLRAGAKYVISGWFKANAAAAYGFTVSDSVGSRVNSSYTAVSGAWEYRKETFQLNAAAIYVSISFGRKASASAMTQLQVRGIQIEEASVPSVYRPAEADRNHRYSCEYSSTSEFAAGLQRIGNVVKFTGYIYNNPGTTHGTFAEPIPDGYKPTGRSLEPFTCLANGEPTVAAYGTMDVQANGTVGYYANTGVLAYKFFDMEWFTEDDFPTS